MWRRLRSAHVLLHVQASGDSPVSLAMTHMRWAHGQSGHESTDDTLSVSLLSVGGKPGPSTGARTRTWADVNVRPRPLVCEQNRLPSRTRQRRHAIEFPNLILCCAIPSDSVTDKPKHEKTKGHAPFKTQQNMTNNTIRPDLKRTETRQGHATRTNTNNADVGVRLHFALEYATFLTFVSCQHPWPCDWSRWVLGSCPRFWLWRP